MAMSRCSDGWREVVEVEHVCDSCGCKFAFRYDSDRTFAYVGAPCDCDARFHPVEGKPSLDEWLA